MGVPAPRFVAPLVGLFALALGPAAADSRIVAPERPPGVRTRVVISVHDGRTLVPVNRGPDGAELSREETLARAEPILRRTLGPNFRESNTWKSLDRLTDPEFAAVNQRIIDLGRSTEARINLHPRDGRKPVDPHVETDWIRERDRTTGGTVYRPRGVMNMGERGLAPSRDELGGLILHETGHLADAARVKEDGYGKDQEHHGTEILSPSGAMQEGWGNYTSTWLPERFRGESLYPDGIRPADHVAKQVEGRRAGVHTWIAPWDRTAGQYLANEEVVAGVLADMEKLPGGRAAVEQAFRETNDGRDRTVADMIGAYARAHPDRAPALREIVDRWTHGRATEADHEALLAGRLPPGTRADQVPLGPDYKPSPIPQGWDEKAWAGVKWKAEEPHPLLREPDLELARRGRQTVDPDHPTYIDPARRAEVLEGTRLAEATEPGTDDPLPLEARAQAPGSPGAEPTEPTEPVELANQVDPDPAEPAAATAEPAVATAADDAVLPVQAAAAAGEPQVQEAVAEPAFTGDS